MMAKTDVLLAPLCDVVDVVRAAIDLGALKSGGLPSAAEMRYVRWAKARKPLSRAARRRLIDEISAGLDPLGEALLLVRDRETRRRMGSFYTPPAIVKPMVSWLMDNALDIVIDPGCGSGRFVAEVARRSPNVELLAIDKDPVATLVTRAVLGLLNPRRVRVLQADFLALETIARAPRQCVGWIGNPPYVRHQMFGRHLKVRGVKLAAQAGHESLMTAGLHALFFTKTKLLAEPGDVGCYVTPSEWVDNRSGRIVRDLFLNGLGGEAVLLLDPETFAFAGVKTTAAITTFVISRESAMRRLAINVPVADLEAGFGTLGEFIPRTALTTSRGWSRVVNNPAGMADTGPTIGDLFDVHRGTATGANSFWVMTPAEAKEGGLSKYGVPSVTRASEIIEAGGFLRRRPNQKLVLSFPKTFDRKSDRHVDEFLRAGERANDLGLVVSEGSNARKRVPWWSFSVSKPAIVATYMARRPPVFAANPDRLGILNIAIAIDPKIKMDATMITTVVEALNAAAPGYEEYAIRYFGNLRKFEPKIVAALPLPVELHHLLPAESRS